MAFGINRAMAMGRLTKTPELRRINGPNGDQACVNLTLKSTELKRDGSGYANDYLRVVVFGKTAENIAQHLQENSPLYVEGRLHTSKWEDGHGQTRSAIEIIATETQFLPKELDPNAVVGMNRVLVAGNVGSEPQSRMTGGGTPVGSVSLGVNGRKDATEWLPIVGYEQNGEAIGQVQKGQMVQFEGRLHTRSWDGENGKQYKTEIVADKVRGFEVPETAPGEGPAR
jgi:single-strand DNA-binding protein